MRCRCQQSRAFTLIEAVLVVIVLSVTVPAGMRLVGSAERAQRESEFSATAVSVARSLAEQILADVNASERFGPAALGDASVYLDDASEGLYARTAWLFSAEPGASMTPEVTIGGLGVGTEPGFRRIEIEIRYTAHWGATREFRCELDVRGE